MRKSTWLAAGLVTGAMAVEAPAFADFGKPGQIAISADRLFGLSFTSTSNEDGAGGGKTTDSRTNVSLLWPPLSLETYSPYTIPRLGADVSLGSLTVGGTLGFVSSSGTTKNEPTVGASTERDSPSITIFALAPRVGYALPLTPLIAFWPRAGVTYYSFKLQTTTTGAMPATNTNSLSGLGVNLEPMFVISPVDHFGIVGGPVLDFPLSGTSSTERNPPLGAQAPDDKVKFTNYGLSVGVVGYF